LLINDLMILPSLLLASEASKGTSFNLVQLQTFISWLIRHYHYIIIHIFKKARSQKCVYLQKLRSFKNKINFGAFFNMLVWKLWIDIAYQKHTGHKWKFYKIILPQGRRIFHADSPYDKSTDHETKQKKNTWYTW